MWPIGGRVHTPVSNPSLTLCNEAQYDLIGSPRKNCGGIVSWFVSGTVGVEVGGAYIAPWEDMLAMVSFPPKAGIAG